MEIQTCERLPSEAEDDEKTPGGPAEKAGVKLYRYKPGFMHQKVMLIDDVVGGVGSPLPGVFVAANLYNLNPGRDGDHDGIACEKR